MNPMTGFRGLKVLVIDDDHAFFEIAYNGNHGISVLERNQKKKWPPLRRHCHGLLGKSYFRIYIAN